MSMTWLRGPRHQSKLKTTIARLLRSESTEAEEKLWSFLRAGRLNGLKFRRQVPFGNFYLDFYCAQQKLAIELDGSGHGEAEQRSYDEERTKYLLSEGIRVLRYSNRNTLLNSKEVLNDIRKHCHNPLPVRERVPVGRVRVGK